MSQLRNITVDNQEFVYWYSSGINISPKENKNIKITLMFEANSPEEHPHFSWVFYDIKAQRNGSDTVIHLGKPKHIAEMISHLLKHRGELFTEGKPHILDNAWDLLIEMGYSDCRPVWILGW